MSFKRALVAARQFGRKTGLAPEFGQEWLYHGTSRSRAKTIKKTGFMDAEGGISSASDEVIKDNEGLLFLTPKKSEAQNYARNQELLDEIHKEMPDFDMKSSSDKQIYAELRTDPLSESTGTLFQISVPKSVAKQYRGKSPYIETELKKSYIQDIIKMSENIKESGGNLEKNVWWKNDAHKLSSIKDEVLQQKANIDKRMNTFKSHVVLPQELGNAFKKTTFDVMSRKDTIKMHRRIKTIGAGTAGGVGYMTLGGDSSQPQATKSGGVNSRQNRQRVERASHSMFKTSYRGNI